VVVAHATVLTLAVLAVAPKAVGRRRAPPGFVWYNYPVSNELWLAVTTAHS
jgi:hypothetical protein